MPREPKQYPKNIDEFLEQGWDKTLMFRIRAFNLKDFCNSPEDLVQDILLSLINTHYLERFSPDKGSFKTYLFGYVDNFLKKRYNKENTRTGRLLNSAASLSLSAPESDAEFNGREVFAELIDSGVDDERAVMVHLVIEDIRKELKENYAANSSFDYKGHIYERDPLTVFDLMMAGASVMEVAEALGVSRQFIYHLLRKIRQCEAAKEFFD